MIRGVIEVREVRVAVAVIAALACALFGLALPSFAAAFQTYDVDNTGDGSTKALCEAHITNECTLRGAIEAANATTNRDVIHFAPSPFDGEGGLSTIVLGSALPAITEPVQIDAGKCPSAHYNVEGPCAEVDGSGLTTEFECKLDGGKWAKCKSPTTYKKLKPGKHTFRVRAKANPLTGPVTKYQFTVKS